MIPLGILAAATPRDAGPAPGAGYRYYRMYITANNGDASYTNIVELELRGAPGGAALTPVIGSTDARVLYSSQYSAGSNFAFRAFDGSTALSTWITDTGLAIPSYIGWDFGVATVVKEIAYATNASSPPGRAPKDFRFEGSNDGSAWDILASYTGKAATAGAFAAYATGL